MKVTNISVSAGRTFNHPYEQFSNLRPHVQINAELVDGEDPEKCIKELQAKAEGLVEDHKQHMLKSMHTLREMEQRDRTIARLESVIKTSQEELQRYRENPIKELPSGLFQHSRCDECGKPFDECEGHD